ncbi:Uma2 family endonuclease [Streptomyces sp. NEAU-Y11]|uniref:Uma2 family endonuclease n=1 Tax=Streptomyces cucumeris TaxID=2962890 RepID=UPI0020C89F2E|nr:Uma2 family endonuclease [Streptomyces sp. NEAU-Y11]MCP9205704.1 Uma2 family endonuclease [Streptomyces sp. NEAU-Y11]
MSAQPHEGAASYAADDPETALKYAIQHIQGDDRVQIVEGVITPLSPSWGHEKAADKIRNQIASIVSKLGCVTGSGNLDLPGTSNWYVSDVAVVPEGLADAEALTPDQTLLVVENSSDSNEDIDRIVKRRRYAEYGAPLYLLVDRQQRACTLYSAPGNLGYTRTDGPLPFGTPLALPEPFDLELDTSEF